MSFQSLTNYRGRRARRRATVSAVVVAIAGLAATPALGDMETATCESLSIGVDGPDYVQSCAAGDFTNSGVNGPPIQLYVEGVAATATDSELLIGSYKVGGRAYLMTRSAKWFVSNFGWFESIQSWGEGHEVGKFKAVSFEGRARGAAGFSRCVGFVRYLYRVPRSIAGYRQAVGGAYCKDRDADIPAYEVENVLQRLKF
jgi:hypothetical protein